MPSRGQLKTATVASLAVLSLASAMSFINCNIGWVVECFDRNPYWCLYNIMLFFSRKSTSLLQTICYNTFDIAGKMLMGRQLLKDALFPDLKIGTIFVIFSLSGTVPVMKGL